ncbi:MAG: glyoxylate/hydroxypyruvate reductase A [Alphaproteobacteria bacterium]|nr:glyoxylate/hydroxypyruvate reductase A [Alphaproteobacteria bacterium]
MALLFKSSWDRADWWREELLQRIPDLDFRVWPDVGDEAAITYALVWKPKPGDLARYRNLKAIFSLGAGVDHLLADPTLPRVPVCRLVDRALTRGMTEHVLTHVLRFHRNLPGYERQQHAFEWKGLPIKLPEERIVCVMGLGELGGAAAKALAAHGFHTRGWSRTPKTLAGVESYAGNDALAAFLKGCEILVCLLPLTRETEGILSCQLFAHLPRGACLINAARGAHLVEEDLIPALDTGQLGGAALDVFRVEPLPRGHPYWTNPRILITPHVASVTDPRSSAELVAENIRRVDAGEAPLYVVDPRRGY